MISINGLAQFRPRKDSSNLIPTYIKHYHFDTPDDSIISTPQLLTNHIISSPNDHSPSIALSNIGSEWIPIVYKPQFKPFLHSGRTALDAYCFNASNIPYVLTNKPISQLEFTFFGYNTEYFRGMLSQNISKKLSMGVGVTQLNSKGYFDRTATKHHNYYAYLTHQTDRWLSNLEFAFNSLAVQNYGSFETDVERLLPLSKWKSQEKWLASTEVDHLLSYILLRNRLLVRSRIQASHDTEQYVRNILSPIVSPFYIQSSLGYSVDMQQTFDPVGNRMYYGRLIADTTNAPLGSYFKNSKWHHSLSIHLAPKTLYNIGLKVKGYWQIDINQIRRGASLEKSYPTTSIVNGLGGTLDIKIKNRMEMVGDGYLSLSGYTQGDWQIKAKVDYLIDHWRFSGMLEAYSQLPGYFYSHMITHTIDEVYDFKKMNTLYFGCRVRSDRYNLNATIGYRSISNWLFYDAAYNPSQEINWNGLQLSVSKELSYKILYSLHEIDYQSGRFENLRYQGTLGIKSKAFDHNLTYLIGSKLTILPKHTILPFNPVLMQSYDLSEIRQSPIFPMLDLFLTLKIGGVHLSVVNQNLSSAIFDRSTYSAVNVPITPSALYLRMVWRFFE